MPSDVQLWNWQVHWQIWPSTSASFPLPSLSLLQVWVCWFPPAPSPRAGCMRCMWRYTGRTAWGNFPTSLCCFHVGTIFLCIPFFFCFPGSSLSHLFELLWRGGFVALWQGLGMLCHESLLFIVDRSSLSFGESPSRGHLLLQVSYVSATFWSPWLQSWRDKILIF